MNKPAGVALHTTPAKRPQPWILCPEIWLLCLAAFATRFWHLFTPNVTVFDEVYFKNYAVDYLRGTFYFDPHPPLVKLLFGFFAAIFHISPIQGMHTPETILRVLPALAGSLLIPLLYLFIRQLGGSRRTATLGALCALCDNALLVESRFILTDSFLLAFGVGALVAWLAARKHTGWTARTYYLLGAFLAGCCVATKWTGLTILALLVGVAVYDTFQRWQHKQQTFSWMQCIALGFVPLLVYCGAFVIHFSLLPNSGQGDAFMPADFQQTLHGNRNYNPSSHMPFIIKLIETQVAAVQSEQSLENVTHPYSSPWYTWPIEWKPVYYWSQTYGHTIANIVLLGNPVVWWGTALTICLGCSSALVYWLKRQSKVVRQSTWLKQYLFLAAAYAINWLPFGQIHRAMFLYHYLFALLFAITLTVILLGNWLGWNNNPDAPPFLWAAHTNNMLFIVICGSVILGFLALLPLSYGWSIGIPQWLQLSSPMAWR